jgi:hypothetical protein
MGKVGVILRVRLCHVKSVMDNALSSVGKDAQKRAYSATLTRSE